MQGLRKHSIYTFLQSVDKTPAPYNEFRNAATSKRVWFSKNEVVKEELKYLVQDNITGKVDHDPLHSKDVCDAMASVCFTFSKKEFLWTKDSKPKKIGALKRLIDPKNEDREELPKVGRVTLKRPSVSRVKLKRG